MVEREILTAFAVVLVETGRQHHDEEPPGGTGTSRGAFQQSDSPNYTKRTA